MSSHANEQTPLLASSPQPRVNGQPTRLTVHVSPTLKQAALTSRPSVDDLCPELSADGPQQTAYALIVLLHICDGASRNVAPSEDVWDSVSLQRQRMQELQIAEENIAHIWNGFVAVYRSPQEIETVLWTEFSAGEHKNTVVKVVDYLCHYRLNITLLSDDLVLTSLWNTWKRGRARPWDGSSSWLSRYDSLRTPRIAFSLDLLSQITFLALLANYTVYPPRRPSIFAKPMEYIGLREGLLMYLSLSLTLRCRYVYSAPFFLTLAAFVLTLPSVPFPEDASFKAMLIAIYFHVFQLHTPHAFSPLLILKPQNGLPVAALLRDGFIRIIKPMLFFIPVLLLSMYLLSFSLAGTFFRSILTFSSPTPIETRSSFFILVVAIFTIIGCAFFVVLAISPPLSHEVSASWDRYSRPVGNFARKCFCRAVVSHLSSSFPAPFNVPYVVLIVLPRLGCRMFHISNKYLGWWETALWRFTVGPIAVILSLLFRVSGVY